MTWEGAPWMIEGGVKHSANIARLLSYAAFGGDEGIVSPLDLEVRETVPGSAGVRVMPGACSILNRGQGIKYEAYVGRNPTVDTIPITPTTASGGRTDLIIVRVENPFQDGEPWAEPTPEAIANQTAQFIRTAVISGVNPGTTTVRQMIDALGYSAIPLAFVTLPASTSVVQQSHIQDLRRLPQARREEHLHIASTTTANMRLLTSANYVEWIPEMALTVQVPPWATHVLTKVTLGGVRYGAGGTNGGAGWGAQGSIRADLGSLVGDVSYYDVNSDQSPQRTTLLTGSPLKAVPASMRGTNQVARLRGLKSAGSTSLRADNGTIGSLELVFIERPEASA